MTARFLLARSRLGALLGLGFRALGVAVPCVTTPFLAAQAPDITIKGNASDAQIRMLAERLLAKNAGVRDEAQRQLLARGPQAVGPLLQIANRAPMPLALAIKQLMPRFGLSAIEPLCDAVNGIASDWNNNRRMWILVGEVIAEMGEPAIPKLLEMFERRGSKDYHYSSCANRAFFSMPALAAPALVPYLKDSREELRRNAATVLAQFQDARTVDALLECLGSPDHGVRMYCADALGDMKAKSAVEPLLEMLTKAKGEEVRAAMSALGKMYEPRFRAPLVRQVRFGEPRNVRETAANLLIHSGDPKAARLGRRYKPPNVGVDDWWMVVNWYVQSVLLTALLVYFFIWLGAKHLMGDRIEWRSLLMSSWGAALGLLIFGFLWGCVFTGLSVEVERGLLLLGIPGALGFAWLAWISTDESFLNIRASRLSGGQA